MLDISKGSLFGYEWKKVCGAKPIRYVGIVSRWAGRWCKKCKVSSLGSKELKRGRGRGTTFLGEYTHTLELLPLFVYILWDRQSILMGPGSLCVSKVGNIEPQK